MNKVSALKEGISWLYNLIPIMESKLNPDFARQEWLITLGGGAGEGSGGLVQVWNRAGRGLGLGWERAGAGLGEG